MARFQVWDQFDLRAINFNTMLSNAAEVTFYTDDLFTLDDRDYDDTLQLAFNNDGFLSTTEFYGTNLTGSNAGLTGGTVTAIYSWWYNESSDPATWYYNTRVTGVSISATELDAALKSASRTDDAALLTKMLAGSDTITMSAYADWMNGQGGNDAMRGLGGNDTLLGGIGADTINGNAGRDQLFGGRGNDILTGSLDADRFVFAKGDGADRITDFRNGSDKIVFSSGADRYGDLSIRALGSDTMIRYGADSVLLKGVPVSQIDASDFIFT